MRKRFWKELRAIDLVIVFSFIALVAYIIVSRYSDFKCRAMQSEAKFSLEEIYAAQKRYHAEHDRYASMETLLSEEQRVVLSQKYYSLTDRVPPGQDKFSVQALGAKGTLVAGELWWVNEQKDIVLDRAVCSHGPE